MSRTHSLLHAVSALTPSEILKCVTKRWKVLQLFDEIGSDDATEKYVMMIFFLMSCSLLLRSINDPPDTHTAFELLSPKAEALVTYEGWGSHGRGVCISGV